MKATPHIAVAGGGFSGAMLAVQLAANAQAPLEITLYDANGAFARGLAHGTRNPHHLLNVRSDRMGAFPDKPDDFYGWLLASRLQWQSDHPALAKWEPLPDGFAPRLLYGDYLASLLLSAQQNDRNVTLRTVAEEVTDAAALPQGISLTLSNGTTATCDRLVLAVGNLPAARRTSEEPFLHSPHYNPSLWTPSENSLLRRKHFSDDDAPLLIIGTGLTMVDALVTLHSLGYEGKIIALSRHGLLPQPHKPAAGEHPRFLNPETSPSTAYGLFHSIRNQIRKGADWRAVIDSLRADTPALWAALPERERKKLTRVLSYWSTHRHRMPPESAALIERETAKNALVIEAGHMTAITEEHGRFAVELRLHGGDKKTLHVAHIINCAGPNTDIATVESTLLKNLAARGLIQPGPLKMGLAADETGKVKGNGQGRLFALGPLLTGERLETIAVPELRQQAKALALALLADLAG